MLTYVGPSDLHVNHKNGNKLDNKLSNLEYVTHKENMRHAVRTWLNVPKKYRSKTSGDED